VKGGIYWVPIAFKWILEKKKNHLGVCEPQKLIHKGAGGGSKMKKDFWVHH
jgi:hypothetical protein